MKTGSPNPYFQNNRSQMFEALLEIEPTPSFCRGIALLARVIAYYIPSFLIALTGVWVNNLTMMLPVTCRYHYSGCSKPNGKQAEQTFSGCSVFSL